MQSKRVLLAEDDEFIRQMVRRQMAGQAFWCDLAADGEEALKKYHEAKEDRCPFDLLVLDMMMLPMNGLQVAEAIRKEGDETTPIVLWTALGSPTAVMRAHAYHVQDVWDKIDERDPGNLVDKIKGVLGLCRREGDVPPDGVFQTA